MITRKVEERRAVLRNLMEDKGKYMTREKEEKIRNDDKREC